MPIPVLLLALLLSLTMAPAARAEVPAAQVMTLYRFNGPAAIPYYEIASLHSGGPIRPAGSLAQGSSLIPCVVVSGGEALTDRNGVPYVGFKVVVDAARATPASIARFQGTRRARQHLMAANHHCPAGTRYALSSRDLYDMKKPPVFEPPAAASEPEPARSRGTTDQIVRAFHNSASCAAVNTRLMGRRAALQEAWASFSRMARTQWSPEAIDRARHLDYTMRTAIFEGHLGRGCSAYGTCERNIIALSIRNRARESCSKHHGCVSPGDFTSVASAVSQYNIWDEYVTQTSSLTSCFLRNSGGAGREYPLYRNLYEQNVSDVERILYGGDSDLAEIFPGNPLPALKALKHYYHAPAMGKCFPQYDRVEYLSGAVARKGNNFVLLADTRIKVGARVPGGYLFQSFLARSGADRDTAQVVDNYPGFVVDARRISLKKTTRCAPYGIPQGCTFERVGRYRKTPSWVNEGRPIEVRCRVQNRGELCNAAPRQESVRVGGTCDVEMRPFAGVK
ncbi:hypothetical protein [Desulfobulbus oralis]|uniref:Sporulation stage II protein D amidase enhancer LytB N-terminal domain-containing protein n=1 Tax=Desulfobulbus oralis TaxID=1986146 RepID=A0A2L1GLR9_9BACT|nr:hypothetical protein [Desulfobulbus oralis]AVD70613.1 hypothetical protein CAY53_03195 [Desulfobulbus oralis]